ncbi:hypothetical protein [Pseudomonas sp. NPDC096950]|uniref:hypothetical protein n=1 Tax=Pseudomonas sp. NPDC096950 TaxID=3364485 RepID=UPI00383A5F00
MNTGNDVDHARIAADLWNAGADEFNQWDALGQDEKDELIAEQKLLQIVKAMTATLARPDGTERSLHTTGPHAGFF